MPHTAVAAGPWGIALLVLLGVHGCSHTASPPAHTASPPAHTASPPAHTASPPAHTASQPAIPPSLPCLATDEAVDAAARALGLPASCADLSAPLPASDEPADFRATPLPVIPGDCTLLRSACAATDRAARHGLVETATRWQEWCSLADRCEALVEPYSIARRGSCSDAAKARAALLELQCRAARELPALLADTGLEMLTGHAGASRWLSTELPRLIGDPSSAIDRMAPQFPAYQTLLAAGDRYRTADPPESVPDGLSRLRPGRTGNAVPWLRRRLSRDGIDAAPLDSTSFDRKLRKALEAFQQMHGLSPSGKVDRKTVEALSTPPEVTWRLLRTALAAWRRAVPPWESSFILVQVPQAFVELHLDSRLVLRMRAVVGSTGREKDPDTGIRELVYRTLPLNSAITAIVVNPDWRIPTTIVDREITPRLDGDPDYLERRNIRVEQFESGAVRYIQEPGDRNAMGRLKFRFPNRHGFYLHDSPDKRLFRRAYRLYSHGCIRVEHAAKLAERLLARDKGWNFDQLRKTLRRGETREVPLTTPIPIHVIYSTAAADSDGNLYFFPDWYGLEEGVSAE